MLKKVIHNVVLVLKSVLWWWNVTLNEIFPNLEASAFDYLDAPVERVTGMDVPLPYSPGLESMALPQVENVVNVIRKVLKGAKL